MISKGVHGTNYIEVCACMKNLETAVIEKTKTLSGSLKEFGEFIIANKSTLINSNTQNVSDMSGISTGTIYRFIKLFNYKSLENFAQDYMISAYQDRRPIKQLTKFTELDLEDWNKRHFELELENVGKTGLNFSTEDANAAARMILEADNRWIVGWRLETAIASYLHYSLNYMLGNTTVIRSDLTGESILSFNKNDVLIVVYFQRYSSTTLSIVKQARAKKMRVIAITDTPDSPIKDYADVCFIAYGKSVYFLDSYTAGLSVCNALIAEMSNIGRDMIYKNIIYQEMFFDNNHSESKK